MSKKIDQRLPIDSGKGSGMREYAAIKSPWERMYGFRDAMHYANRFEAVISAAALQAYRILVPDYAERCRIICESAYERIGAANRLVAEGMMDPQGIHPFMCGEFTGALSGDQGDDALLMCGRVQDFGSYRCEKELDECPWDICGSELCRATTMSLQSVAEAYSEIHRKGPSMEYCMVEAKGCGDRHCRIVAENREKYPMPEHEIWESFGPVATMDQIKYTPEEDCVQGPMVFREECNYTWSNGTNAESGSSSADYVRFSTGAAMYILPAIDEAVKREKCTKDFADHVLRCVMESSGKSMFGEKYAIRAVRDWMGVPDTIGEDGRLAGGLIEMQLQSIFCDYQIEAFNKEEVILVIDRGGLAIQGCHRLPDAHVQFWYGMVKTLVNPQWSLWEENSTDSKLRIKIAKKIDKSC